MEMYDDIFESHAAVVDEKLLNMAPKPHGLSDQGWCED
jgi:hypothetical protein